MFCLKLLLLLVIFKTINSAQLCHNSEFACLCEHTLDQNTQLPVKIADCRRTNRLQLPLEEDFVEVNHLDFSFNRVTKLQYDSVQKNPSLTKLTLSYNNIATIESLYFENFEQLEELNLTHNFIQDVGSMDAFYALKKLTKLDLSFNQMTSLPRDVFVGNNLRFLDLSYNNLGPFLENTPKSLRDYLGLTTNITHLILNAVNFSTIRGDFFDEFNQIKHISLADNHLQLIPNLPNQIEWLDVSGNLLTFLSTHYLNYPNLKVLKLNRMPSLAEVRHYAFSDLPKLNELYLSDCLNLVEFSDLAFGVLSKNNVRHPKLISLARNGLVHLDNKYRFIFDHMNHVDLEDNPFECNCDILWLKDYKNVLFGQDELRCGPTNYLANRTLLELQDYDLPQCYPEKYGKRSQRILLVVLTICIVLLIAFIAYLMKYPYMNYHKSKANPTSPYGETSTS